MGNFMSRGGSCYCSTWACFNGSASLKGSSVLSKTKVVRIVHSEERQVFEKSNDGGPIKMAELMLEYPGHFVSELRNNDQESQGCALPQRAIRPLPADYEAAPGHVYILFPMHRLGQTRVPAQEYDAYSCLLGEASTSKKRKQGAASSKVVPLIITAMSVDNTSTGQEAGDKQMPISMAEPKSAAMLGGVLLPELLLRDDDSDCNGGVISRDYGAISLMRSKSWIPRLETIIEGSVLAVPRELRPVPS